MSKRTEYRLDDADQMRSLGAELSRHGFTDSLDLDGTDWSDGDHVYGALSDLDWYEARWRERTVPFRRERGFHPVAGEVGRWPIYMMCDQDTVTLVES